MGVWKGPMGGKFKKATDYTFSGTSQCEISGDNWEIALKSSGSFKFKKDPGPVDVFLVGSGMKGNNGSIYNTATALGGNGGAGGELVTQSNVPVKRGTIYPVQIGVSTSADVDTSGFGFTALGQAGNEGGAGSSTTIPGGGTSAGNGTDGDYAFGASTSLINSGVKYGASGAGGGTARGTDYAGQSPGTQAATGGGTGGAASAYTGTAGDGGDGQPNTGAGGGGGGSLIKSDYSSVVGNGGAGASGIIIIRNHRGS